MKALLYSGHELITTDAVAEALLDYVMTLPLNQRPDRIMVPALRDGSRTVAQLVLTAGTPLAVTTIDGPDTPLDGEDYAIEVLRRKTRRLDSVGFDLHT
ncbi:hypothetical protein [Homoserinibacter sp. GY 40078]|uniref:hypothetical protein n=1 Tax=Homoserinibacter sp. GY 40078 TaxID=2603275 RepID=UPI0011CC6D08|nr:hypothetical protein [Homoserinibacter sp. GY 40078]TXK19583.1 hypothetical protein FVQ89_06835 [Homoserinibacter sp. GY 40078]